MAALQPEVMGAAGEDSKGAQLGSNVKDLSGCWSYCGGLCCQCNVASSETGFINFCCILPIPFPICRCFTRIQEDPPAWKSCTDLKGNSETWTFIDSKTIKVQGNNECLGEGPGAQLKRGCCAR
eukprot:TRINITY_DN4987_c0_g2_i1.p2 TRINITY_DN4987_c0_g2~~TRINITY_DN4987_c0_g2_i1.p2  ORF type:complete len:124 (+),score=23.06 TRINITY_DN4987_c0_g2_i1:71-442(+)